MQVQPLPARGVIENEAENHIALGRLLRKERLEPRKGAVKRILASELSVPQKIEKIREVDEGKDDQEVAQVVREAAAQAVRRRISGLSRSIKAPVQPLPYFSYLFREHGKIRQFGEKARVLVAGIWPPGLKADPGLGAFFVEKVQAAALALLPRLMPVTEHGWLHLAPAQYNEVMLLRRLVQRILDFDFVHADFRDRTVIGRLQRIEGLFLMIHYKPATLESIVGSLHTVYRKQDAPEEELDEAIGLIVKILDTDSPYPSLANCLLGLNILRFRRFLTFSDLVRKGLGDMVGTSDYDCSESVRKRIDDYRDAALASAHKLQEQIREARRLNSYVSRAEDGSLDAAGVRAIYNVGDRKAKYDFARDQQNIPQFVQRLLRRFDGTFSSLLNGQLILDGEEKRAVFSRQFFQVEFSHLRTVAEKLEKGPLAISAFPLSRYLAMKESRLGAIGDEMEVRQLIDEGVAGLVDLGKIVALVLSMRKPSPPGKAASEPLEQVVLQGKPFSLPGEERRIVSRGVLEGKTVVEALGAAVSFCFTSGLLLQDQFLFLFLEREARSRAELAAVIQMLENLVDPDSLRDLKALSTKEHKRAQHPTAGNQEARQPSPPGAPC